VRADLCASFTEIESSPHRIVASMALELFTSKDLPTAVRQEIVAFLDSQDTGHPLQFPQWAGVSTSFAVLRQAGQICWFASCGTHFPLGRRFQAFRALMINRGPVCDDRTRWQSGLEELVQHAQEAGFVFLKAAPDWLHRQENDATLDFGQEWEQDGGERASLRLDLTKSNENCSPDSVRTRATRFGGRTSECKG